MAKTILKRGVSTRIRMPRVIIASGSNSKMRWKNWLDGITGSVNSALVIPNKMKPRTTRHKEHTIPVLRVR